MQPSVVPAKKRLSLSPLAPFQSAWTNRALILRLATRDILARYRASVLGIAWSVIVPLVMLAVYTFVFSGIFRMRWATSDNSKVHFAVVLFCGLLVFNFYSECMTRAPSLILSHKTYVKKVVFPLEVLPWISALKALFNTLIGTAILLIFYVCTNGLPSWEILLAPLVLAPFVLSVIGVSLFLSSLGVYIRDIQQIIGVVVTVSMFMSPIFYPLEAVPPSYREIIQLSPLAIAIQQARAILFTGTLPSFASWALALLGSWFVLWLGFLWFSKTRKGFADVI